MRGSLDVLGEQKGGSVVSESPKGGGGGIIGNCGKIHRGDHLNLLGQCQTWGGGEHFSEIKFQEGLALNPSSPPPLRLPKVINNDRSLINNDVLTVFKVTEAYPRNHLLSAPQEPITMLL